MDPLERLRAAVADRYRVEREVGAGGMATVYLAADLKHDRKVALKVLKPELAAVLGAERFVVEIKTTAALQHPHILPLFDSGEADGFLYYVMPFIDGETLRSKLDRETQLGIEESVKIASAVADALDYAHRHGVIHRDIKPENILIHDGRPVVADFGIALAVSAAAGGRMTETGLSLGTPHYMSPEQATAEKEITGRSDIYSLGSVLYEMLTGNPPHTGASAQQIIMKIVTEEAAPVTKLRRSVPPNVADAVAKSIEKMPADRFATAEAFRVALNDPHFSTAKSGSSRAREAAWLPAGSGLRAAGALVAVALVAAAAGWLIRGLRNESPVAEPITFTTSLGRPDVDLPYITLSHDGRKILQAVSDSTGANRLTIRDLGTNTITVIPGTEEARGAAFSQDGQWIAYVVNAKLWKVAVHGGPATTVVDDMSVDASGVTWTSDGDIIFSGLNTGLWRVPSAGGKPVQLTHLDAKKHEFGHWYPRMLPGDRAMIFTNFGAQPSVEAYDFKSGRTVVLAEHAIYGRYAPSGQLLYARDAAVFAVDFDAKKLETHGTAVPVQDDVVWQETNCIAGYDVSPNGTFVFLRESDWSSGRTIVWRDRAGHDTPVVVTPGLYSEPRLSPDGRWIALTVQKPKLDIFLYDVGRRVLTQLTRAPGAAFNPVWTADSKRIVYTFEAPVYDIHMIAIDGSGADRTIVASPYDKEASSISPDGARLLVSEEKKITTISFASLGGSTPLTPWPAGALDQRLGMFSPDGRWIAYVESAGGRADIYIRSVSGEGGRRLVSANGGAQPRWTKGGREIVYTTAAAMMSVAIDPQTGNPGTPAELFRVTDVVENLGSRTHLYDVTADGERFLFVKPVARAATQPVVVMLNWRPNLRGKTQ